MLSRLVQVSDPVDDDLCLLFLRKFLERPGRHAIQGGDREQGLVVSCRPNEEGKRNADGAIDC